MKKLLIFLLFLGLANLSAQDAADTAAESSKWKRGGNFGLQFTQASYSNWQAGGVNSIAANTLFSGFANYQANEKWSWSNTMLLAYGLNFQDTIFNKTDDRIELESRVDFKYGKTWSASGFMNFRSQFMPGYANPGETGDDLRISDFMAPGYLLGALGFTHKPSERFTVFLSPATMKATFVMVDRLAQARAFGVEAGSNSRYELGGYLNLRYKDNLFEGVDLEARLDAFSNYLEDPTLVDINSEVIFFFTVNEYIKANLSLAYVYDHDVKFDLDNDPNTPGVARSQFRQILSIGFTYQFGDKPPKK